MAAGHHGPVLADLRDLSLQGHGVCRQMLPVPHTYNRAYLQDLDLYHKLVLQIEIIQNCHLEVNLGSLK